MLHRRNTLKSSSRSSWLSSSKSGSGNSFSSVPRILTVVALEYLSGTSLWTLLAVFFSKILTEIILNVVQLIQRFFQKDFQGFSIFSLGITLRTFSRVRQKLFQQHHQEFMLEFLQEYSQELHKLLDSWRICFVFWKYSPGFRISFSRDDSAALSHTASVIPLNDPLEIPPNNYPGIPLCASPRYS